MAAGTFHTGRDPSLLTLQQGVAPHTAGIRPVPPRAVVRLEIARLTSDLGEVDF